MVNPAKTLIYVEGTFAKANPTSGQLQAMEQTAAGLGASGFGTVILASLYLAEDGTFYYNDTPFSETLGFLPSMVAAIKAGGTVRRVLLSIGRFGSDHARIRGDVPQFKKTLARLVGAARLDGIDLGLEHGDEQYADLLVDLAGWAAKNGLTVTAAPHANPGFWMNALRKANSAGPNPFAWWNLQVCRGASYGLWVSYLSTLVENPQSFLVPGYDAGTTVPSTLSGTLHGLQLSYPSLSGSFIWQYERMDAGYSAAEYAAAIWRGLGAGAIRRARLLRPALNA